MIFDMIVLLCAVGFVCHALDLYPVSWQIWWARRKSRRQIEIEDAETYRRIEETEAEKARKEQEKLIRELNL